MPPMPTAAPFEFTELPIVTKTWKKSAREEEARKGVLVVDDESAFCDLVTEVVSAIGYKSWPTNSAEAALRTWAQEGGDIGLAILDVVMPSVDGLTLMSELRRRDPRLNILLVSGHLDENTRWLASESGCFFLSKPFDVKELSQTVEELLGPTNTASD